MPKSKPPRRKRARHVLPRTRSLLEVYDAMEQVNDQAEREAEAMADKVPPEELAMMRATCAANRRMFAEARAELLTPSRTPVLDRLATEARRQRAR